MSGVSVSFVVSFDISHGIDDPVMLVCARNKKSLKIINQITGDEAKMLYSRLLTIKEDKPK